MHYIQNSDENANNNAKQNDSKENKQNNSMLNYTKPHDDENAYPHNNAKRNNALLNQNDCVQNIAKRKGEHSLISMSVKKLNAKQQNDANVKQKNRGE